MLGNISVPVCPTNLDNSRARAYCTFSRCGCWLVGWLVGCFGLNDPLRQYFSL